jgi:hypothetical protein
VPASADEVVMYGTGTWEQLNNYIEADEGLRNSRGQIVDRNASVGPWSHTLDFHYGVDFAISKVKTELTLDLLNLMNLIDSDSGVVRYPYFNEVSPIRYRGIDTATGKPIYELLSGWENPDKRWTTDDLRSRWQAKLGLRLSF